MPQIFSSLSFSKLSRNTSTGREHNRIVNERIIILQIRWYVLLNVSISIRPGAKQNDQKKTVALLCTLHSCQQQNTTVIRFVYTVRAHTTHKYHEYEKKKSPNEIKINEMFAYKFRFVGSLCWCIRRYSSEYRCRKLVFDRRMLNKYIDFRVNYYAFRC